MKVGSVAIPLSSAGDANHVHTQDNNSMIWEISHQLGKVPSIVSYDKNGNEIVGVPKVIDNNNIHIYFNGACSGKAYCN